MRIKDVGTITKSVLERHPETRADDSSLYFIVCYEINPVVENLSFADVMANVNLLQLPTFESVSRARRKIQSSYKELQPNEATAQARLEKQKEVLDYVKSKS